MPVRCNRRRCQRYAYATPLTNHFVGQNSPILPGHRQRADNALQYRLADMCNYSLTSSLNKLTHIEGLRLNNNLLTTLPDSFCKGIKVGGQLQLMHNKLASVPDSFAEIRAGLLSLQSNPICELRAGKRVRIAGIQSRSELNGQYAECITHEAMKRRWVVKIEGSDERVSLKELNLSAGCPKIFPNVTGIVLKGGGASPFLGFQGEGTSGMFGSRGNTFGQPFRTPVPDL